MPGGCLVPINTSSGRSGVFFQRRSIIPLAKSPAGGWTWLFCEACACWHGPFSQGFVKGLQARVMPPGWQLLCQNPDALSARHTVKYPIEKGRKFQAQSIEYRM